MVEYLLDQLMELFNVDLSYFAERVPVIDDIVNIFVAVGWALLIGNLAYQAMRSMASGVGIEAEEPGRLFLRSAMFSFLLLVSRQICAIGFGLSATVMEMLQAPDAITFDPFGEETFDTLPNAGWLIVIVVNIVIQWQLVRLFFEVAERYVILCVLTYCAPLAFAMGGSKSTGDIFRGWLRMFASMCVLMVFNLVFVKLVLSALSTDPNGAAIIPWAMLVVGIVRMAKKMDGVILRIGLNPALTGDPLGARFPSALTAMALRSIASVVTRTAVQNTPFAGHSNTSSPPHGRDPLRHSGIPAGGRPSGAPRPSGTSRPSAAGKGTGTLSRRAADKTAAQGAYSGARVADTLAAFRSRYGADNAEAMRQVRQAISIDADDWGDENYTGSVVQNNTAQTVSGTGSRVMLPAPPKRPLPENFGRMDPPQTDGKLPPVMPQRTADGQASHMVSPVTPRPPEQVHSGSGVIPERGTFTAEHGNRQLGHTPQAGKISQVMPPSPQQIHQDRMGMENHTSISNTERPAAQPVTPPVPAGGTAQEKQDTAPIARASAATVAAGSMASGRADVVRISPAREAPPRSVHPAAGRVVSTAKQQTPSTAQQRVPSPARVMPSAPHKTSAQTGSQVAPTQAAAVTPAAPSQAHAQPAAKLQPDVAPADRRPTVTPAKREQKPERLDTASHPDVTPGVRTPDMVTPPPAVQPRTLRRSAQPLKSKAAPETPKGGGTHNRKRRRKK